MSINPHFNFFPNDHVTNEQLLVEDLVIETLGIHGMPVYYLPRTDRSNTTLGIDTLYGEDPTKQYVTAHAIEMYLENTTAMEGEGDFISKFGLEIRDEVGLLVSRRRFKTNVPNMTRPREGDLVYVPLVQNFFEITHVEHENNQAMMYTLGRGRGGNVYVYSLRLKQFVFSDEIIETGIDEVDDQILDLYRGTNFVVAVGGSGTFDSSNTEIIYQGANLASATVQAIVRKWTPSTRTIDAIRVQGTFTSNVLIRGASSNAAWTLTSTDTNTPLELATEDVIDNKLIQQEADSIIDFSETNPFSEGSF